MKLAHRTCLGPLALVLALRAAALPPDWSHVQTLQVTETGLIKVSLPLETLDAARADLADLRLYDDAGREVPFRIERPGPGPRPTQPARNFRVTLSGTGTVATFETDLRQPIDRLTLETPAQQFIKAVSIEGGPDGQTWQPVARGQPVFRRDGASRLHVEFPPVNWTHWRVTVDDRRTETIPLTGARLHAAEPMPVSSEPLEIQLVERDESAGQTRLTLLAAGAHVTLAGLHVEAADPLFTRAVTVTYRDYVEGEIRETELARGTIYRVALEDQPVAASLSVAAEINLPTRELILSIENGDSPPLTLTAVRATRRPVYLVWLATEGGAFHLLSGNTRCAAPRYDLAALAAPVSPRLVQPARVGALAANPAFRAAEPLPEIRDDGTPIDLARWKYRKRVALAQPGVQQAELDLETLSRAARGLEDLRLVRDGKQIPYLLERPPITRSVTPEVARADDPKRPSVSRWRIRLPHPALPVTQLVCDTDAPFFQRSVNITELVSDERGVTHFVTRAMATWTRTLDSPRNKLVIPLTPPAGDTLVLEMENGDNPPLALREFALRYPAVRLVFKATSDGATFLYFGNPRVARPRYDLDLVARALLAAPKYKATLGPTEPLKTSRWAEREPGGGRAGWVFWGALGMVVVALLWVMSRLLPRGGG